MNIRFFVCQLPLRVPRVASFNWYKLLQADERVISQYNLPNITYVKQKGYISVPILLSVKMKHGLALRVTLTLNSWSIVLTKNR